MKGEVLPNCFGLTIFVYKIRCHLNPVSTTVIYLLIIIFVQLLLQIELGSTDIDVETTL